MFGDWTFGRKIGAGFAFSALVLLVVALVGYQSTESLIANDKRVAHTHEVRTALANLFSQLKDSETGMRGYIITGDEDFLEPYQTSLAEIKRLQGEISALTVDNDSQQERLGALSPLIDTKLATTKDYINKRKTEGVEAAIRSVSSAEGQRLMDQIRAKINDMDKEEADLLRARASDAEASAQSTETAIVLGSGFGVLLIALIGWLITRSLSSQIGSAVSKVQSSSTELQAAANQQATGSKEQATAMSEITTTISELLATTRQIAESAQRVAQIAEQTARSARSGEGTVDKTQEAILGIRRQVDLVVNHMLELGKRSQQIGAVLDIVSELAEQTNILAINATIEAAGAGEAGRRFAVVADEIRKLADRVTGSTKEIRSLIEDVRSSVNTTVMATETGSKAVDNGAKLFTDVAAALKQITSLATTTTDAAKEIELSTKQQTTAVEQVNVAISNVAQATKETEVSASQTLQTASQLALLSRELLQVIQAQAAQRHIN